MVAQGYFTIENIQNKMSAYAVDQLSKAKKNDNSLVWPAQWVLGLTGKSIQNVLRSNEKAFLEYVKDFDKALNDSAEHCLSQVGDYKMTLGYTDATGNYKIVSLNWEGILKLTTIIGAQTLTIRGSDKSIYGKLFEKLLLGSILTIFGFKRVNPQKNEETNGVFWLSDSSENRESDATLLFKAGSVARFDIGFIGPGNSEISKDKLSRFESEIKSKSGTKYSVTFIIVDRLPQTTKTQESAKKIGAEIIQMSMQFWPRELAVKLGKRFGFKHPIQNLQDGELNDYLKQEINKIDIQDFLSDISILEIMEQSGDAQILDEGSEAL